MSSASSNGVERVGVEKLIKRYLIKNKKTQMIILSACHSCIVTCKVHHHTTSSLGIRVSKHVYES
jgi:hypothetical protein